MSEIEKLYKNAHIEKVINHECTYDYGITCPNDNDTCENCGYYKEKEPDYPPFTAEKQIELIKKLGNINIDTDNGYYMSSSILEVKAHCDTFEETLAEFINNLWQGLTESEQEQIRSVLNG